MDLTHLRPVLTDPAPTSTILLDASRDAEDAEHEIRLRWQALADRLRDQGASAQDLAALESAALVPTGQAGQASRLVAARDGRVVLDEVLPTGVPDGIGTATVGPFADVTPLLSEHRAPAFVLAKVDRTGADVETYEQATSLEAGPDASQTVKGGTLHIRKVHPGGWSDRRYDNTVEENWKENAQQVADEVVAQARRSGAHLVVVAGDVRARTLVRGALPQGFDVVEVEGDVRAAGASQEALEEAVRGALQETAAADVDSVVDRLRTALSADGPGAAAPDLAHAVAALQQGRVSVLVLDPPALRTRTLVVGPQPHDVALPGGPRTWQGEGVSCPADLALVRAAVLTDAQVEVLTGSSDLHDGAAALLRWEDGDAAGGRLP